MSARSTRLDGTFVGEISYTSAGRDSNSFRNSFSHSNGYQSEDSGSNENKNGGTTKWSGTTLTGSGNTSYSRSSKFVSTITVNETQWTVTSATSSTSSSYSRETKVNSKGTTINNGTSQTTSSAKYATVYNGTTSTSSYVINVYTTSTETHKSRVYTTGTSDGNTKPSIITTTKKETSTGRKLTAYTVTHPRGAIGETVSFATFDDPENGNQIIVYDTIIECHTYRYPGVGGDYQQIILYTDTNTAVYYAQGEQESYTSTKLQWVPPRSIILKQTAGRATEIYSTIWGTTNKTTVTAKVNDYQVATTTFSAFDRSYSTSVSTITFFTATEIKVPVEGYVTYTTSFNSGSNIVTKTSYSLDTGVVGVDYSWDEDIWDFVEFTTLIEPHSVSFQTSIESYTIQIYSTESFNSYTYQAEITKTTETTEQFIFETGSWSEKSSHNIYVNPFYFPWVSYFGDRVGYISYDLKTSFTSTVTTTVPVVGAGSNSQNGDTVSPFGSTGSTRNGGTFGVFYKTFPNILIKNYEEPKRIVLKQFLNEIRAASPDLDFDTAASNTDAPLMLIGNGNKHTFRIYDDYEAPLVIPDCLVPIPYPSFSTIISQATHGYLMHPTKWSSITLERIGANFSSTWRSIKEINSSGTTFTTESGICNISTANNMPFYDDFRAGGNDTIGGYMQPNKSVTFINVPSAAFITVGNDSQTNSLFTINTTYGTDKKPAQSLSVISFSPVARGYGYEVASLDLPT